MNSPRKKPQELRSQQWFGRQDRDGFAYRSWVKGKGVPHDQFDGRPVIGICNGFQALVKSGFLPGNGTNSHPPEATLTFNARGHFECRWVTLKPVSPACLWTQGLAEPIDCPVAHGEGNFVVSQPAAAGA